MLMPPSAGIADHTTAATIAMAHMMADVFIPSPLPGSSEPATTLLTHAISYRPG
jgi:hypothetical protein